MKKIDAHIHIYERMNGYGCRGELIPVGKGTGLWANGDLHQLIPEEIGGTGFRLTDLIELLDRNEIERAVLLQGNLYGFQNLYIKQALEKYPDRLTGACAVDPFARQGKELMHHFLEIGFRAAKFEFSDNCGLMSFHHKFPVDGEMMLPYYEMLEDKGAVLVVDIGAMGMDSYQPEGIARIAKMFPGLSIVVCHLLAHRKGEAAILREELELLKSPNIWYDVSALPWNTAPDEYPFPAALEYIRIAKDIAGCRKLLWGSDAPGVIINTSYRQLFRYLEESDILTDSEKELVFYKNAAEVYFKEGS